MSTHSAIPDLVVAAGLPTELVRGEEQIFLDRLLPMVQRGPVALDLAHVERIDAAGIAALITLYAEACSAGTRFAVVHASTRVQELLALVGLAGFLLDPAAAGRPRETVPSAA